MTSIDRNRAAQRSSELANKTASQGTSWLPAAVNRALKGYLKSHLKDNPEDQGSGGANPQDKPHSSVGPEGQSQESKSLAMKNLVVQNFSPSSPTTQHNQSADKDQIASMPKKSGEASESFGQGEEKAAPAGRGAGRGAGSGDRSDDRHKPYDKAAGGRPQSREELAESQRKSREAKAQLDAIPKDAFGKYPDDAGPGKAGNNRPMWSAGHLRRNRTPEKNALLHWKKHGKEMNLSPEEYVRKANDFAEDPGKREHIRVDTGNPNSVFMGDMDTGEVVIMDKDGVVRSYYKLDDIRSDGGNRTYTESFERAVNWQADNDSSQNTTQS
jgi:hypothetical protein